MPFQKVTPEKLATAVVRQIETLILRGILRPGERLPAERELAERFGVSRPSLRDAIAELQEKGLLISKASSGIYVADVLSNAFSPALRDLFSRHSEAVFDYLSFRRDIESLAAHRAARLASDTDLKVIDTIFGKMDAAHGKKNAEKDARLDAEFHMSIIEASHNVVMLHMMRSTYQLLQDGVFFNRQMLFRQSTIRDQLLAQHRDINTALQARDPDAAKNASIAHIEFLEKALADYTQSEAHEAVARQRYEHEKSR